MNLANKYLNHSQNVILLNRERKVKFLDMHPINAQFITILVISCLNVIQLSLYTAL